MSAARNSACPCGSGAKYKKCCLSKDDASRKPQRGEDALMICVPTRGQVSHETLLSIEQNLGGIKHCVARMARKPVAEARNALAKAVLEQVAINPFPFTPREVFVLWLDDDAWIPPTLVPTMVKAMRELPALDALFAWFGKRVPFSQPVAYRCLDDLESFPKIGIDCQQGDLVPVEAAGFHTVLMRVRLLERIGADPFTPNLGYDEGEDWAFCRRARAIGARMAVGTAMPSVHIDPRDGMAYIPGMPAALMDGNGVRMLSTEHMGVNNAVKTGEVRQYGLKAEESARRASAKAETGLRKEVRQRRATAQ